MDSILHLQNQMFPESSKLAQCLSHPRYQKVHEKKLEQEKKHHESFSKEIFGRQLHETDQVPV